MLGFRGLQGCFKGCQFILGYSRRGLLDHLQEPLHLLRLIRVSNVLSCSSTGWALGIDNQGAPGIREGMKWERVRAAQPYEPFTGARDGPRKHGLEKILVLAHSDFEFAVELDERIGGQVIVEWDFDVPSLVAAI